MGPALSSSRVLTTELAPGIPIDQVTSDNGFSQDTRNRIARRLLWLTIQQLFEWRFMQTDPNWANFLYHGPEDRLTLIDFGAAQEYSEEFVDEYLRLVWGAANLPASPGEGEADDPYRRMVLSASLRLGFLTGEEGPEMLKAHEGTIFVVGEPFRCAGTYDFASGNFATRLRDYGAVFAHSRLTAPPPE